MNLFEMFLLAAAGAITFGLVIIFFISFWWQLIIFLGGLLLARELFKEGK